MNITNILTTLYGNGFSIHLPQGEFIDLDVATALFTMLLDAENNDDAYCAIATASEFQFNRNIVEKRGGLSASLKDLHNKNRA